MARHDRRPQPRAHFRLGFDELRTGAAAVAKSRAIDLTSFREALNGWAEQDQSKWAVWRHRLGVEQSSLADFGEQLEEVARFLEPVFINDEKTIRWNHINQVWVRRA